LDALPGAVASDARWLWLLHPAAAPRPDALGLLTEAAQAGAVVVAGTVVDERGRPVEHLLPGFAFADLGVAVDLVQERRLPIRHASFAHCLVARDALVRYGLPDVDRYGPYAPVEWSARVLRSERGLFAAGSVAAVGAAEPPPVALRATLRTWRAGAWTRGEAARVLRGFS
jgi:hypothetical protein